MASVVGIGEILVEIVAERRGQRLDQPGRLLGPYPSGAPAIFIDQAARMGVTAALIGVIGDDPFGHMNRARLIESGADVNGLRVTGARPTGSAFVAYDEVGGRAFVFNIDGAAPGLLAKETVLPELFEDCQVYHVMGSSLIDEGVLGAVERGAQLARAAGAQISVDPNVRPELLRRPGVADALRRLLAQAAILLPSAEDLRFLYPNHDLDAAAHALLDHGARIVLVKDGAAGTHYFDAAGARIVTPAYRVDEIDPTGAGDCCGAAFLAAHIVQGRPLAESLSLANAAGAHAVTAQGPMAGTARLDTLQAFIEERQS